MMRKVETEASNRSLLVTTRLPGHRRPVLTKQLKCQIAALRDTGQQAKYPPPSPPDDRILGVRQSRAGSDLDQGLMA
jgi:hypothetical protein